MSFTGFPVAALDFYDDLEMDNTKSFWEAHKAVWTESVKAPMMSGDGIATDEFAAIGGPGVAGTLMTFAPDPQKRPEAAAVVKKFLAANFKPEAYTLYSYATLQVMATAAAQAKSTDPKKVAEAIRGGKPFSTVIGSLSFNKKGDITRPDYTMYTWKKVEGDKITYVQN